MATMAITLRTAAALVIAARLDINPMLTHR